MTDKPDQPQPRKEEKDARDAEPVQFDRKPKCDVCGSMMVEWHCRMLCPACGYQRDCSDP